MVIAAYDKGAAEAKRIQLLASAPIKPSKPQIACDHGLFSDEADQLDLCEMFMDE